MPLTLEQHERKLYDPALCEQLPVRDYLDNIVVRTNGAFVAGYELRGLASYFASDEGRDRGKLMLEMLTLADSLEQQTMTAAPGSASMVTAQARVADLETQAQLAKMLAAQLRQEATKLAHQNALLKQRSAATQSLQNQIQQVLAHP